MCGYMLLLILESLVANDIFSIKTLDYASWKEVWWRFFSLDILFQAKLIWCLTKPLGIVEEVHNVEFDESTGSQNEDGNLDNMRGIQLNNTIKNMSIDDMRPREVIEDEEDHIFAPSNVLNNDQYLVLKIK